MAPGLALNVLSLALQNRHDATEQVGCDYAISAQQFLDMPVDEIVSTFILPALCCLKDHLVINAHMEERVVGGRRTWPA